MKYIRTKDGIIVDTTKYKKVVERTFNGEVVAIDLNHWGQDNDKYPTWIEEEDIVKQADTIENLIQVGDIVFYYDFHSQKEQCMYVQDLIFARELNITKLLIPVGDDYKCVAKAEHRYLEMDSMKQIVKKGELELL